MGELHEMPSMPDFFKDLLGLFRFKRALVFHGKKFEDRVMSAMKSDDWRVERAPNDVFVLARHT